MGGWYENRRKATQSVIPAPEPDSCSAGTVPHPVPRPLPRTMPQPRTRHPLFSSLGVPVTTGMSDWYENNTRPPRYVVPSREGPGAGSPRPCQQATPFSYLGVPVTTGMSDWYENRGRTPTSVIPAKAGIQSQPLGFQSMLERQEPTLSSLGMVEADPPQVPRWRLGTTWRGGRVLSS